MEVPVVLLEGLVRHLRNQGGECSSHSIADQVYDGALEEDLENGCQIGPEATSDMNSDVVAVDVNNYIHCVDGH